jgi:hypothetical protein
MSPGMPPGYSSTSALRPKPSGCKCSRQNSKPSLGRPSNVWDQSGFRVVDASAAISAHRIWKAINPDLDLTSVRRAADQLHDHMQQLLRGPLGQLLKLGHHRLLPFLLLLHVAHLLGGLGRRSVMRRFRSATVKMPVPAGCGALRLSDMIYPPTLIFRLSTSARACRAIIRFSSVLITKATIRPPSALMRSRCSRLAASSSSNPNHVQPRQMAPRTAITPLRWVTILGAVNNCQQRIAGASASRSGHSAADTRSDAANLWKMHRRRGQAMVFW